METGDSTASFFVGTAGWSIPALAADSFESEGSHLERYSRMFNCVEINSSFYREHKPSTYAKWAQSTPEDFRFSVKLLRYFTQEKRLKETGTRLEEILFGFSQLQEKWGALLVQLPPSLEFESLVADVFFAALRKLFKGLIVVEPRHKSWASERALHLLAAHQINKVLADPEPCFVSRLRRQKVEKTIYFRLHGTPDIYKSRYGAEVIERIAIQIKKGLAEGKDVWCTFDNTTFGFGALNAFEIKKTLNLTFPLRSPGPSFF